MQTLESASIPLSCWYPSTGPNKFAKSPFCVAIDWYFLEFTPLCLFHNTLSNYPGWQLGQTVPSVNSQQFANNAPVLCIKSLNWQKCCGDNCGWIKSWSMNNADCEDVPQVCCCHIHLWHRSAKFWDYIPKSYQISQFFQQDIFSF